MSQGQQKTFEEENPDAGGSQSWLSKNTSSITSASELSSSETSHASTSASERDAPTTEKAKKKTKANDSTERQKAPSGSDGEASLRKENKKLQVKTKKAEVTADNLKKKMKQDAARTKALQDENKTKGDKIKTQEDEIKALKDALGQRNPEQQPASELPHKGSSLEPEVQP